MCSSTVSNGMKDNVLFVYALFSAGVFILPKIRFFFFLGDGIR
jgi:hypothetical protein